MRARIEHVFGRQAQFSCHLGRTLLRCIGIKRARATIGLRNLTYNLDRYARLAARPHDRPAVTLSKSIRPGPILIQCPSDPPKHPG